MNLFVFLTSRIEPKIIILFYRVEINLSYLVVIVLPCVNQTNFFFGVKIMIVTMSLFIISITHDRIIYETIMLLYSLRNSFITKKKKKCHIIQKHNDNYDKNSCKTG